MAVTFYPGQTIGRTDLSIYLQDVDSIPINAYEIGYAVYYVDPGPPELEVLIGAPTRIPINPTVGEYYASLMVPPNAQSGTYRIRWTFKQYANSPIQTVTQVFTVVATAEATLPLYTNEETEMMRSLRILLRDQCVGGEELVTVDANGIKIQVRMDDLWGALKGLQITPQEKEA